jgi:aromatic ring-opening dioxygenase catalytic subunit (LigB family)
LTSTEPIELKKMSNSMPALYVPHGGGPAFFMSGEFKEMFRPTEDFLRGIRGALPAAPTAILVVTAHWESDVPTLTGSAHPGLIYDYYGFPPETYALQYRAPGSPELAARAASLLRMAGFDAAVDASHGWDHGVFIPLMVMFPQAEIPVVSMSLQASLDPVLHCSLGAALRPLRDEGVLVVGSGTSYHNLRNMNHAGAASQAFEDWLDWALSGNQGERTERLGSWAQAPGGRESHPREEHLLPLMVASGAGTDTPARKLWSGLAGSAHLGAWAFD